MGYKYSKFLFFILFFSSFASASFYNEFLFDVNRKPSKADQVAQASQAAVENYSRKSFRGGQLLELLEESRNLSDKTADKSQARRGYKLSLVSPCDREQERFNKAELKREAIDSIEKDIVAGVDPKSVCLKAFDCLGNLDNAIRIALKLNRPIQDYLAIIVAGYDFNINRQDEDGRTLLHEAAKFSQLESFNALLEMGANPTLIDNVGNSVLHTVVNNAVVPDRSKDEAALRKNRYDTALRIQIIEKLHELGVDFNFPDRLLGNTPLHDAMTKKNRVICEVLIRCGASQEIKNKIGKIPQHYWETN